MSLTTEQMQTALANAGLTKGTKPDSNFSPADVVASIGSGAIAAAEEAVAGTIGFFDRVRTRYAFNRAVRKGLIPNPDAEPQLKVTARRRTQASRSRPWRCTSSSVQWRTACCPALRPPPFLYSASP